MAYPKADTAVCQYCATTSLLSTLRESDFIAALPPPLLYELYHSSVSVTSVVLWSVTRNVIEKMSLLNASFFTAKENASHNLNHTLYCFLEPSGALGVDAIHRAVYPHMDATFKFGSTTVRGFFFSRREAAELTGKPTAIKCDCTDINRIRWDVRTRNIKADTGDFQKK